MPIRRPPRGDGPYSPKHSTGGVFGSRSVRVVAAAAVVAAGVVGVVWSTGPDSPGQVQVMPSPVNSAPTAAVVATTTPATTPTGTVSASVAPRLLATAVPPESSAAQPVPTQPVPTRTTPTPSAPTPARSSASAPAVPSTTTSVPGAAPVVPPAPAPAPSRTAPSAERRGPEPVPGRVLLDETAPLPDLPLGWDVPTGSTSVRIPLPDPVTVTGEVGTPAPDRVEVEITVERGARPGAG